MHCPVSIRRCHRDEIAHIEQKLKDLLQPLAIENELPRVSSVVIKPNVCWGEDWRSGSTTSPLLVKEVVKWLRERGVDKITIAEGSMVGHDTFECFEKTGFLQLARELDLKVVDLNKDTTVKIDVQEPNVFDTIEVARTIAECEFLINMPVMKTHINTTVTLSMKNLKGVIPHQWKRKFHFMGLDGSIADLASIISSKLVIMDGIIGQQGQGPLTGTPANAGLLIAGRDQFDVDLVACRIMGFAPYEVRHLALVAEARGIDLESYNPIIVGEQLSDLHIKFERPVYSLKGLYKGVEILWGDPCSGCAGALSVALERMEKSGELEVIRRNGGIVIALGRGVEPAKNDKLVLLGKCQYRNRDKGMFIPGCPPPGMIVREMLSKFAKGETKYGSDIFVKEAEELYKKEK
ncbi:MAG: DUF362 domain-containing protein [Methanomassiliicoccales archaeon]|nr:DUF362 domain-containing protein [Methanomassiliicoccales archaeon]